tara:strand:- start:44 stop:313 length:270 start_codon:yes stop_codon:yes gene_type:complete
MRRNLGQTNLKIRRRSLNSFKEFDCLPHQLREWVRNATLPWSPRSVRRAYNRAFSNTGNSVLAIEELERIQRCQLAKDQNYRTNNGVEV